MLERKSIRDFRVLETSGKYRENGKYFMGLDQVKAAYSRVEDCFQAVTTAKSASDKVDAFKRSFLYRERQRLESEEFIFTLEERQRIATINKKCAESSLLRTFLFGQEDSDGALADVLFVQLYNKPRV